MQELGWRLTESMYRRSRQGAKKLTTKIDQKAPKGNITFLAYKGSNSI
jgi:hypothetical protein